MSERDDLGTMVRDLIDSRLASTALHKILESGEGYDRELWSSVSKLGLVGVLVPEEHGGAGAEFADMAVILQEIGRRMVPLPLVSTGVLAVYALTANRSAAVAAELLPSIADGSVVVAVTASGPDGQLATAQWDMRWRSGEDGTLLDGTSGFVLDAADADEIIVCATADGNNLVAVVSAEQAEIDLQETRDQTRRFGRVTLSGVVVPEDRVLARGADADRVIARIQDAGALAMSVSIGGLLARVTESTAEYVSQRHQFGRAIGSFQAVKHKCADMVIAVESSRVAVDAAVREWDLDPDGAATSVSTAKAHTSGLAVQVCGDAVQVHGGIGFTWEHEAHLWLKRAVSDAALFGSSSWHWRRVADSILPASEHTAH